MKKFILSALFALFACITFGNTTFKTAAVAPWNQPLMVVKVTSVKPVSETKKTFDDPYVTNYGGWVVGAWYQPPYQLALQVNFDHSVPVKYYATFQVLGVWDSAPGGASYKEFQVIIPSNYGFKTQYFPLNTTEEAYPNAWCEVIDYGPY
jgi:hypothetical protein